MLRFGAKAAIMYFLDLPISEESWQQSDNVIEITKSHELF